MWANPRQVDESNESIDQFAASLSVTQKQFLERDSQLAEAQLQNDGLRGSCGNLERQVEQLKASVAAEQAEAEAGLRRAREAEGAAAERQVCAPLGKGCDTRLLRMGLQAYSTCVFTGMNSLMKFRAPITGIR